MDTSLRGPSLQEIVLADRTVWVSVSELIRDHGWSLSDSLNEVAFCRGEMANLLQARPRPPRPPSAPSGDGKGDRKRPFGADAPGSGTETPHRPGKADTAAKPKGKAKASPNPPPKGFDPSWFRTINGKEACMRFAVGKCTKEDCRFFHGCPVPLPNGKPCGQPHTALEHAKTPH